MDAETKAKLDHLRAITLGAPAVRTCKVVEWRGGEFEVRRPTLRQQREIEKASTDHKTGDKDGLKAVLLAILKCVYVPGTDVHVFGVEHIETMENRELGDFVGVFMTAIGDLAKDATPESAEKNS